MEGHANDKDWWPQVSRRTMVWYPSEWDARKAEAEAIDAEKPLHNKQKPDVSTLAPPHGQRKGWRSTIKKSFGGYISADLHYRVTAAAKRIKVTNTDVLNEALADWLDKHETPETTGEPR